MEITLLVNQYKKYFLKGLQQDLKCYSELSYDELIKNVSFALTSSNPSSRIEERKFDKKQRHQMRRTEKTLDSLYGKLSSIKDKLLSKKNNKCTFEELYEYIADEIYLGENKINGVGPLFLYDTALRIGAYFEILPKNRVFIHSGAEVGLKYLLKLQLKKGNILDERSIDMRDIVNDELLKLKACYIEDFLCVYKDGNLKEGVEIKNYCHDIDDDPNGKEERVARRLGQCH
ncbi:hypothetical protein [Clostridium psychrophilum]|uniref:hypothetical protein n=1 Tax=Clostridium psychrophilum TaxID=132926 RepID=UPI001C0B17A3|nr:hypothetical protein [Clostridium psychrophilum]MBU3180656.1 hypothetical protein [Clostridium psychrophilum]